MKYLSIILMAFIVTCMFSFACTNDERTTLPDKPYYDEERMVVALYEYFNHHFGFDLFWAHPWFPLYGKWTASYYEDKSWLVKAYDVDYSYAGTWLVPESVCYTGNYEEVQPFDREAELVDSGAKGIAEMPPRPPFLRLSNSPREDMIQAVALYIARMSKEQAAEALLLEMQRKIQSYYPLEWNIQYEHSMWRLVSYCFEYKIFATVDPYTGRISAYGY